MKRWVLLIVLWMIPFLGIGQISSFTEKYTLPQSISETSGLLFYKGNIITHNDSGDAAVLYELDAQTGSILRTITISNATHVDWEDITQDDSFIYIGDFGNNNGNRQDLTIYKISKASFDASTSVTAETILFSYEDQTNFAQQTNSSNFDAEAMIHYDGFLYVFTKNWSDLKTNAYQIPKSSGTHVATKVSSFNAEGLVTGAVYDDASNSIMLCGYDTAFVPFLLFVDGAGLQNSNVFSGGTTRISLSDLEQGSQIEGITHAGNGTYYLSRERITLSVNGVPTTFEQKMYSFTFDDYSTLSVADFNSISWKLYPNPSSGSIYLHHQGINESIQQVEIFDLQGKKVRTVKNFSGNSVDISDLTKGLYVFVLKTSSGRYPMQFIRF